MVAFALLAVYLALMSEVEPGAIARAGKAVDLRAVRVAGDTIFRRYIYEIGTVNDGDTGTLDVWYGEFIGLKGAERDRWAIYRGVLHKKRGLVAGTDPTGMSESLFESSGSTTAPSSSSSSSSTGAATESGTGEEAYLLTLEIFVVGNAGEEGEEKPVLTIRTIVPIPPGELEAGK